MSEAQVEAVRDAVAPALAPLGLDLYDVEVLGGGGTRTLRVTVAREGGVDLETITAATQAVSPAVDQANAINGPYLLEVSSPGLERSLRRPEHFRGALREDVTVKFHTAEGPRRVRGTLADVTDSEIVVDSDDGERAEIPLADITQARTVFEWQTAGPKPRAKGSKQ